MLALDGIGLAVAIPVSLKPDRQAESGRRALDFVVTIDFGEGS
jgi:hypothetical protein